MSPTIMLLGLLGCERGSAIDRQQQWLAVREGLGAHVAGDRFDNGKLTAKK
jgi:hypothetical protein